MTAPQEERREPQTDEDEDSLLPALLTVYALYLLWRGANAGFNGSSATVRRVLDLDRVIGGAVTNTALHALSWQREQAGRPGDELWAGYASALRQAVDIGLDTLAEALLWTDQHTQGDPRSADAGGHERGEAKIPTVSDPPELLAQLITTAVWNAAMLAAADVAGWQTKVWQTRHDNRVRDAHRRLQGQRQPLWEPFEVGGEKIRFPGDPAVPLALRAGCRCWLTMTR